MITISFVNENVVTSDVMVTKVVTTLLILLELPEETLCTLPDPPAVHFDTRKEIWLEVEKPEKDDEDDLEQSLLCPTSCA